MDSVVSVDSTQLVASLNAGFPEDSCNVLDGLLSHVYSISLHEGLLMLWLGGPFKALSPQDPTSKVPC